MVMRAPDSLLRARRALDELPFYKLVADWVWNEAVNKWVLQCNITITVTVKHSNLIPAKTEWFILADEDYPWGIIDIYPAKDGGLTDTFPHQSHNAIGDQNFPWRNGKICEQTSMRYSGRRAYDIEPFSVDERLLWRINRAREWLESAAAGQLVKKGDPFELPDFPNKILFPELGFVEDEESFQFWQQQSLTFGVATMIQPERVTFWAVVSSYSDERDRTVRHIKYGTMLCNQQATEFSAIWILLSRVPVLAPWKAPATFGELRSILGEQGINFNELVKRLASYIRDRKKHFMLLGFPIPTEVRGKNHVYHWQGLQLPVLSHGELRGFRGTEENYAKHDIEKILANNVQIDWVASRNWAEGQIRERGRASHQLADARVLLIGGGALGSSVAELLVREGCKQLSVVDGEILDIGNLCRHTLSLQHVHTPKADSLVAKLNNISPHAAVHAINEGFNVGTAEQQRMAECDIIIDCTGNDKVIHQLSAFPWSGNKLFVSTSLGLQARRLFLFAMYSKNFNHVAFENAIMPWLYKELKENEGLELPREGTGCWNPVFPARSDDVWLMSAVTVKCIDAWVVKPPCSPQMNVYEQYQIGGLFAGVKMVTDS
jgi:hypothetical protein